MPPATPLHFLVHIATLPTAPGWGGSVVTLKAGRTLAARWPAACRKSIKWKWRKRLLVGTGAFARAFLDTGGASSVFFQLSVNQSP